MELNGSEDVVETKKAEVFKKPAILIGKVGKLPRKTVTTENLIESNKEAIEKSTDEAVVENEVELEPPKEESIEINKESQNVKRESASGPKNIPCPYIEPDWSGAPDGEEDFILEVLKSGVSIENINLMSKPFWVIGRQPTCDISLAHPTISRNHAVIQYKSVPTDNMPSGFYIYDLESTHGTFLNKNRLKPRIYAPIKVGHMLKFGASTRTFLLNGPDQDKEEESELSVTELKQKRAQELKEREEKLRELEEKARLEKEKREKEEEERGIDWGMGEDADEETDLTINPFAETTNEQLYIDDPKKALRGFFEREGFELQYECNEQGFGQFRCTVDLPIDDANGRPIVAEAIVKGKKKEAVVQCALEACRILDRHGVLRQAMHESKKRKARNWEENDYYDSDEDTFLDRTGTIEKKREKRMKAKQQQQPETYQTLMVKEKEVSSKIKSLELQLDKIHEAKSKKSDEADTDSLDDYMKELADPKLDKYAVAKIKNELNQLRKEHTEVVKLVNLTRPANLPPLVPHDQKQTSNMPKEQKKTLPMFGKRLKVKVMLPSREVPSSSTSNNDAEEEEEEMDNKGYQEEQKDDTVVSSEMNAEQTQEVEASTSGSREGSASPEGRKEVLDRLELKMLQCDPEALTSLDNKVKVKISKTVQKLRKIAEEEESIVVDEKELAVKKKKILDQVNRISETTTTDNMDKRIKQLSIITSEYSTIEDRKLKMVNKINKLAEDINKIAKEIKITATKLKREQAVNRMKNFVKKVHKQQLEIYNELNKLEKSTTDQSVLEKLKMLHSWLTEQKSTMLENLEKLKTTEITESSQLFEEIMKFEQKSDSFISTILKEIRRMQEQTCKTHDISNEDLAEASGSTKRTLENDEEDSSQKNKKNKNLRRIKNREEKADHEKKKMYEEDASKEGYDMWVPPSNQSGDGRTSLNDKFGY